METEEFAEKLCNEDPNDPRIRYCKNRAWDRSLIRCVIHMVLRLFERIEREEEKILAPNKSVIFNKRSFFLSLANTMMRQRRKDPMDNSRGVIWNTMMSKRYGEQFTSEGMWRVEYCILAVNPHPARTDIPREVKEKAKRMATSMTSVVNSMKTVTGEERLLASCKNMFNSHVAVYRQESTLRFIVGKMMLFLKMRETKNYMKRKEMYKGEIDLPN